MKYLMFLAALFTASAFAQSDASSRADSLAQNAGVKLESTVNMPASSPNTYARVEGTTNQAATAATVFVNPPSADTCTRAGFGLSAQGVGAGIGVSVPGAESAKCDMRADTINMKVIGVPMDVIKARHCMDAQMAEAYARAGQACKDMRPVASAPLLP